MIGLFDKAEMKVMQVGEKSDYGIYNWKERFSYCIPMLIILM